MIVFLTILLLLQLYIGQTSAIQCYTCGELNHHCPVPFNLDGGDESNENDIDSYNYDADFACMSDHSIDSRTGKEQIILRGISQCQEMNVPNRRVHCCYTNHCNKQLPPMMVQTLTDTMREMGNIESNCQRYVPSMILLFLSMILQCFYY